MTEFSHGHLLSRFCNRFWADFPPIEMTNHHTIPIGQNPPAPPGRVLQSQAVLCQLGMSQPG